MGKRRAGAVMVAAMLVSVALAACGTSGAATAPAATATTRSQRAITEKDFDPRNFPAAPKVDNRWYPLVPGTQFVMEGRANRGHGRLPHQVVTTVTDLTKVVNGVRTVVIWDRDINEGQLEESELAFQAQDNDGNVWLLGEYPEVYEDGKLQGAEDTWIAGLQGARPGVLMRANPRAGTPSYLEGFAPKIEFQDRAKVSKTGIRNCVPLSCYKDVLLIDEWNPLEAGDAHQLKSYAPGVGNIRVGAINDPEAEELVLVKVRHLSGDDLAELRSQALQLDARAYVVRKDLYRHTPPAQAGQSP
jgi:predicted small lipoprotein YifL